MDLARSYVNLSHILIIFPLLLYIGVMKGRSPEWMFNTLVGVSIVGILYHIFALVSRNQNNKAPPQNAEH